MICRECCEEGAVLGLCWRCHQVRVAKSKKVAEEETKKKEEVGMIPFIEAKLLFNVICEENYKLEDADVVGVALYQHKENGMGRVIFRGTEINEDVWQQVMINAAFIMDDNQTTLKVKLSSQQDEAFTEWLNSK